LEHARPLATPAGMSRLGKDLVVTAVVSVFALAGAYWQAERTASFERQDGTGQTLRLVCPLH
jgi:hypothetical protein